MRLVFIRHAEPDYSIDSLTQKGWREAKLLSSRVARWKVDEFYCSPLGRAKDTASFSLQKCGREAIIYPWLREFHAPVIDPETGEERLPWDLLPGYWTKIDEMHDVERFCDTQLMSSGPVREEYKRVCDGIDGIIAAHGYVRDGKMYRTKAHNEDTVVLFCHMGVTFFMLSHLLNISPVNLIHGMFLPPSSVTIVSTEEVAEGEAYFRCQTLGDTSHLYAAGEPVSHMGYFARIFEESPEAGGADAKAVDAENADAKAADAEHADAKAADAENAGTGESADT